MDEQTFAARTGQARVPAPQPIPPLPRQGVIGRDAALTWIYDLFAFDDLLSLANEQETNVSPLALCGVGGVGKTTLAQTIARLDLIPNHFPDGVLWVELGPAPLVRFLLDGWGKALGIDLRQERDENVCHQCLQEALAPRQILLIIDNVWQTAQGNYFLLAGPRGRTLLTTRDATVAQTLATRERTLRIDILSLDDSLKLLTQFAPQAVAADEKSARRLCERLEYLPLGLMVAGRLLANGTDIPLRRLVSELNERRGARFKLLRAERRSGTNPAESFALGAILESSVERLSRAEQERFAILGTFGGEPLTWELEAAAYVWECSLDQARETIAHFIQLGLIEQRGERYGMHALLADYAAERLERMGL